MSTFFGKDILQKCLQKMGPIGSSFKHTSLNYTYFHGIHSNDGFEFMFENCRTFLILPIIKTDILVARLVLNQFVLPIYLSRC